MAGAALAPNKAVPITEIALQHRLRDRREMPITPHIALRLAPVAAALQIRPITFPRCTALVNHPRPPSRSRTVHGASPVLLARPPLAPSRSLHPGQPAANGKGALGLKLLFERIVSNQTLGFLLGFGHHLSLQAQDLHPVVEGGEKDAQHLGNLGHALAVRREHFPTHQPCQPRLFDALICAIKLPGLRIRGVPSSPKVEAGSRGFLWACFCSRPSDFPTPRA